MTRSVGAAPASRVWTRLRAALVCATAALALMSAGAASGADAGADPRAILFPNRWVGPILDEGVSNLSGISYHPRRETLFVGSDKGKIREILRSGTELNERQEEGADFEGVTYNPGSGLLYLAVEGRDEIVEVDPVSLEILRRFPIERTFEAAAVLAEEGHGIESIAFVPNPALRHGGTFFVSNQSFARAARADPSVLLEVEAPLRSPGDGPARILRVIDLGVIDLSALHYHGATDRLYAVSDAANALFESTREGAIVRACAFPGDNQEGLAVDGDGYLYIAQDSGGVIKLEWLSGGS